MSGIPSRVLLCLLVLPQLSGWAQDFNAPTKPPLAASRPAAAVAPIDFTAAVQPILREHCYECHAGEVEEGGLNLAIKSKALAGGEHGTVIVPGDAGASLLVRLVTDGEADRRMPPQGDALSAEAVGILRAWIDQGAPWPAGADITDPRLQRAHQHWAFRRLKPLEFPIRRPTDVRSQTDIDVFVDRQLQAHGLQASPPAAAKTLVRRLYFDLIGLPPTPAQVEQFAAAHHANPQLAVQELVDELLGSPHYGERWARHWLDVARYADSDGQESDRDRPHAYHYRDFVIQALNEDMPYDQFVRWQIAGDEIHPDNDAAVSATGFLTAGPSMKLQDSFLERERLFNRYNELDDIVSTVGTGLLGLTVGCARCHDHKYDAFSSREYYQLLSVFHSGDRVSGRLPSGQDGFFFQDFDTEIRTTWLFRRSDFYDREIEVSLGFPAILSADRTAEEYWEEAKSAVEDPHSTLQRRALAAWITDVDRGAGALLARVIVNRIWQYHFGNGIVRTASDFGVRGEAPTHPDLLEFLATDFVTHGWRLKRLHRSILNSAVWQQTSRVEAAATTHESKADPQNQFLWKMTPRRLEAEIMRDAMLAVSGTLNRQAGGPGFKPYIPPEANLARNIQGGDYPRDAKDNASTRRRSVYMFHKRLVPYPLFQAFDRPELMVSCARRQNTTVAPQALALLNDRFVRAVAHDFAARLAESNGSDIAAIVVQSFQLSLARKPTDAERAAAVAFINAQVQARRDRQDVEAFQNAVTDYCHTLFGLNEFVYVD